MLKVPCKHIVKLKGLINSAFTCGCIVNYESSKNKIFLEPFVKKVTLKNNRDCVSTTFTSTLINSALYYIYVKFDFHHIAFWIAT